MTEIHDYQYPFTGMFATVYFFIGHLILLQLHPLYSKFGKGIITPLALLVF